MLELPESTTIAKQLTETVCGQKMIRVIAAHSPHRFAFFFGDPASYPLLLTGLTIKKAAAYGGLVELELSDNMRLVLGDGVSIRYLPSGTKIPAKHQLLLQLDDGSTLTCTVQMYGGLWAFHAGENDNFYYLIAKEKPSPLSPEFTPAYFEHLLSETSKQSLSAKAFLATQQRIPGLGNGVLQDILFEAGIHPKTKLASLRSGQLDDLYQSVTSVLSTMANDGGRNTEKDLFGQSGSYPCRLSKNTWHLPCPRCGGTVVRQTYLGGTVYFCSVCQPLVQ